MLPRRALLAPAALVALAVFAAFLPALSFGFAPIDDEKNLLLNLGYRGLGPAELRWMFTANHMGHYIPVTWLTLGLDYVVWGLAPVGYHLTSVLFHLATALLLLALAFRLFARSGMDAAASALGASCTALAFAVHPLRVESVVWVSERRDVVCGFFTLLCLNAYVSASARRRRPWWLLTLLTFTLALLSKGLALALPFACLALDATLLARLPPPGRAWLAAPHRSVLLEKLLFLPPALLSAAATLLAIRYVLAPVESLSLDARLAGAAYGLTFYLQKTAVPWPLPLIVHWPPGVSLLDPSFAARAALVVTAAVLLWRLRRRRPALAAAALVYAAFVLPVSGLLQAGPQLVAHRYSYLSCLPWALLAGGLVARQAAGARARVAAWAGLLLVGLALVCATRSQAAPWRDPLSFCTRAVADAPQAWQPRYTLAGLHLRAGRWAEAAQVLRLGLAANPDALPLLNQAALLFATCPDPGVRSGHEARVLAERLMRATRGHDPWAALTWSAALAESGDHQRAWAVARQALAQSEPRSAAEPWARLEAALGEYARGRPLRMQAADWGVERLER